jgi:hypothetical protein
MIPYSGASVYDDRRVYERGSPLTFIKNVRTPSLLVGGDRDAEVPLTQYGGKLPRAAMIEPADRSWGIDVAVEAVRQHWHGEPRPRWRLATFLEHLPRTVGRLDQYGPAAESFAQSCLRRCEPGAGRRERHRWSHGHDPPAAHTAISAVQARVRGKGIDVARATTEARRGPRALTL